MNASRINPLFRDIDLSTTTGIKTFNNAIIGLDDKEKYDGIQYSITKHLQSGKDQGAKYGIVLTTRSEERREYDK